MILVHDGKIREKQEMGYVWKDDCNYESALAQGWECAEYGEKYT
jgi:hypothetical protein